jgi:hypothetical protein
MKATRVGAICASIFMLAISTSVSAALVSRLSGQVIYDNDLNITWLANADLAANSTFGVSNINTNGAMSWDTAQAWISSMNAVNYLGYSDWRLPTTLQPDASCSMQATNGLPYGSNCQGSEMGHLFYNELGGLAFQSISTTHNANFSLFNNIQNDGYWSGTEGDPGSGDALDFYFNGGFQFPGGKSTNLFTWAVRTGDVSAVPIPAAAWLFGSGLLGLIGMGRRKAA